MREASGVGERGGGGRGGSLAGRLRFRRAKTRQHPQAHTHSNAGKALWEMSRGSRRSSGGQWHAPVVAGEGGRGESVCVPQSMMERKKMALSLAKRVGDEGGWGKGSGKGTMVT